MLSLQDGIFLRARLQLCCFATCSLGGHPTPSRNPKRCQVKTQHHPEVAAIDLPLRVRDLMRHIFLEAVAVFPQVSVA